MAFNPDKCLKFTALEDNCTISIPVSKVDNSHYYFSKDGSTWAADTITINTGESTYCKGTNYPATSIHSKSSFSISKKVDVSGNIMSLIDDGAGEATEITRNDAFCFLFENQAYIQSISSDLLPATTLTERCYYALFVRCTGLTSIPKGLLPAMTLADSCYRYLFEYCSGLTTVPKKLLPATTLAEYCYADLFAYCSGLTSTPKDLFPAVTLVEGCYIEMFYECWNLNEITVPFTSWDETAQHTYNWVYNVASEGTFYCPEDLPDLRGKNYIPSGWTVKHIKQSEIGCTVNFLNKLKIGGHVK